MNSTSTMTHSQRILAFTLAILASSFAGFVLKAAPQVTQRSFETPQLAADALIAAAKSYDLAALKEILGPGSNDILVSQDAVQDKNRAAEFAAKADERHSVEIDSKNSKRAVLSVGNDDWPLPIPVVEKSGKWVFDSKAGREELLFRRIGANELDAIQICRGFVEAQEEYALDQHDDSGVNQYAQHVISTPGKHDGLAWQNSDGTWAGPVGEIVAKALEQGYSQKGQPYHGYYFKVLKGQGPAASMGQMDFVVEGAMIGGFALVAAPAQYRVTGVQTFIVSHDGVVYQKDLGPDTLKTFKGIDRFNPDKTWSKVEEQQPPSVVTTKDQP